MIPIKHLRLLALLPVVFLTACKDAVVAHPSGDIAAQQSHLILVSTILMLLIIVPVIALTILFAWRYRQANTEARYEPEWDHSTKLELVIRGAPLMIIIALGLLTWISTHTLDPYRPLSRIDAQRELPAAVKPLTVEVVALDWKWLFIYPEQGIATVNELAAPVDRPIEFKITVMNSFFIPALAGQIYAMPGMETQLHAVINRAGDYEGFSANYSGAGFSGMHFVFHGLPAAEFERWVAQTKASGATLTAQDYVALAKPSVREPVRRYATVAPNLYDNIINRCVEPGKMCVSDMMAIDAAAGRAPASEPTTVSAAITLPATCPRAAPPRCVTKPPTPAFTAEPKGA
jgi:cytochrome o ubiquinol oxidase subunit 2